MHYHIICAIRKNVSSLANFKYYAECLFYLKFNSLVDATGVCVLFALRIYFDHLVNHCRFVIIFVYFCWFYKLGNILQQVLSRPFDNYYKRLNSATMCLIFDSWKSLSVFESPTSRICSSQWSFNFRIFFFVWHSFLLENTTS